MPYVEVNQKRSNGRILVGYITTDGAAPRRSGGIVNWDDHVDLGMSLKPEDATPERVAQENAEARHHGTGAVYDKDGRCHTPGRGIRAREMRRRKFQDNSGGYSDWCGR